MTSINHSNHPPQHGAPERQSHRGKLTTILLVVIVAAFSLVAVAVLRLTNKVTTVDLGASISAQSSNEQELTSYEGAFNVLIIGTDTREGQETAGDQTDVTGARNDVTLMLHVAEDHNAATVISFPRDMLIDFPDCQDPNTGETYPGDAETQFNEGLSRGGIPCVAQSVESLTGLPIRYAAEVSFDGVIALSNAVGGVPICFEGPIDDSDSGLVIPEAGTYSIQGEQALALLRTRYGVGDGSDLSRINSQHIFLTSLIKELQGNATLTNIPKLYAIADAAMTNMTLSTELADITTMASMARTLSDIPLDAINMTTYPYLPYGNRVLPDTQEAQALIASLDTNTPAPTQDVASASEETLEDTNTFETDEDPAALDVTPDETSETKPNEPPTQPNCITPYEY